MKGTTNFCNDDLLRMLLEEDDERSREFQAAAEHVESCTLCQTRLEQIAADRHDWDETKQQLRAVESDSSMDDDQSGHRWKSRKNSNTWTESMAKLLLAPPGHPEMLGRLGRFEIERLIGSGGMGIVFKGFDSELHRPVAIKVLTPHLAGSGAARKRFAREARAAASIVHEHVVAIHNVDSDRDPPFLVMQYVTGESLQTRLDREGSLAVCEILRIARQTALGLAAAHEQGIVHRDVKPSNILLEQGVERALLTDFGLARAADDASLTRSGHMAGTPHYMSPEQARGEAVEQRSDLFSLGSVMYLMSTGRLPFRAESSYGILRRITDSEPRPIREINPDIPEWLCKVVNRLLAKSPDKRYQSAAELAVVLGECLAYVQTSDGQLPEELRPHTFSRTTVKRIAISLAACGIVGLMLAIIVNQGDPNVLQQPAGNPEKPPELHNTISVPEVSKSPDTETAWEPNEEPSLNTVQTTIQDLDERSQQFFDPAPTNAEAEVTP